MIATRDAYLWALGFIITWASSVLKLGSWLCLGVMASDVSDSFSEVNALLGEQNRDIWKVTKN